MKIFKKITSLALIISIVFQGNIILRASSSTPDTGVNYDTIIIDDAINKNIDSKLEGMIISTPTMISAVVPTNVFFNIDMQNKSWNKVISPKIYVKNNSENRSINVDIIEASSETTNVKLVNYDPKTESRAIRMAIAPDTSITPSSFISIDKYILSATKNISIATNLTSGKSQYMSLYGDVSEIGWHVGDKITLKTVFKISYI